MTDFLINNYKNIIRRFKSNFDKFVPYLLISVPLLLITIIFIFPVVRIFGLSMQDYSFTRYANMGKFIFFKNFYDILFHDMLFHSSLIITVKWVIAEVVLQAFIGLVLALLLNQSFKGRGFFRVVAFAPWAVSGVLTTMLWTLMYNQHIGLINDILVKLGIAKEGIAWLSNPNTVFGAVVAAELWRGIPFFSIMMLAGLQGIPGEVYESCEIDGCGTLGKLIYITLPYLRPTIIYTTLIRTIWEFNSIDMIFTMTKGGPVHMTTTTSIYLMKKAIVEGDYGYGSALAVLIFILLAIFAAFYLRVNNYGRGIDE